MAFIAPPEETEEVKAGEAPATPPTGFVAPQNESEALDPNDLGANPAYDPFVHAEELHRTIKAKGGTDEDFGKHPLFPVLAQAQAVRVKKQAESPDYNPAQQYQDALDRNFSAKDLNPAEPDYPEKLSAHKAQIAAQLEEAKRVNQYRARTFGNVNAHGKGVDWKSAYHGIKEGGKELYGVLPAVQGVGYIGQDVGQGLQGIVANDPATLAKAELARRELQRDILKTGLGTVNIGRGIGHWWANRSFLPGGTPDKEKTDAELQAQLEEEARFKFEMPSKITAENYRPGNLNTPAPNEPTHAELVQDAGAAPTAWAGGLRFGQALDANGKPVPANPEEERANAGSAALQFGVIGGATAPGTRLGALSGKIGGYALKAPGAILKATGIKAATGFLGSRLGAVARKMIGAAPAAVEQGALKTPSLADEMIAGRPLVQRSRFGSTVAETTKGALSGAAGAAPFIVGADTPEEGISTALGLGLMGAIHGGSAEAVGGGAWKSGAVAELSNLGAGLKTGSVYDAAHQKATAAMDPEVARQLNAVRGLVSRFKDAQGNPLELHALAPDDYRAMLAQQNPQWTPAELDAAANTRGYADPSGKAFINTGAEGNPTQPGFHEGGHLVKAALEAMDGAVRESAKAAIAETLYDKHGAILPVFNKFIEGYNKSVPESHVIDITKPEDIVRAEDEFIAEHFRNIGNKGDAKGLGAIVTGDTISGRIGDKFKQWAKSVGLKAPDKLGEFGWQEVPEFTARFNKILRDAFKGAHKLPAPEASAANKVRQNRARMDQITALPQKARTPAVLAEYDKLRLENETLAKQGQQIPQPTQPGAQNPPGAAPTSPTAAPKAPTGVSEAEMRENVRKALIQLGVNQRTAKQLAAAAQGASDTELLKDALARRGGPKAQAKPAPAPPALVGATKPGALSAPTLEPLPPMPPPLPVDLGALGRPAGKPEPAESNIVSNDVRKTKGEQDAETAPVSTPEAAAEDAAIEQQVATAVKTKEERLPKLVDLATARAGTDPSLMQRRTDKRGKVSISGRIDLSIPEHRALLKELDLAPEVEQQLIGAQTSQGAKYVDYYSAPKEKGAEGDISGKQRRAEYEADKLKRSRNEKDMQRNKAILFTSAALTKDGFVMQKGLSIDKFIANVHKLLEAAKEHKLGVDYHGINDHQIQQDLDGYVQNHKNNVLGDGSGVVAGKEMTPGYEPYLIPRNRFDLLNAAFHNEASTGQSKYEAKVREHEGALARGEKSRKPALRQETAENAQEAQNLARENQWQVDDETGDTNPFRALLNKEGKLVTAGKGGALRKGTGENLEGVWESLNPAYIDAIRDQPVGDRDIVRDVGYTGEPKGVFSKGLPNSKYISGGFMPEGSKENEFKSFWVSRTGQVLGSTFQEGHADIAYGHLGHHEGESKHPEGVYGEMAAKGFVRGIRQANGDIVLDGGAGGATMTHAQRKKIIEMADAKEAKAYVDDWKRGLTQVYAPDSAFMPEGGALSRNNVANDPAEISRTLGIKYDGPIAGTDAHQFTAPKIGTQGGATFTVRGALTPDRVAGKLAEKQAAFGVFMPTTKGYALGGEDSYGKKRIMTFPGNNQGYHAWDSTNHPSDSRSKKWRYKNGTVNWVQHEPSESDMSDVEHLLAKNGLEVTKHKDWASGEVYDGNTGSFMPETRGALSAPNEPEKPTFYSALERTAADKVKGRATPEQIAATLTNAGVKKEELDWVLGDYLKGKAGQKITPEELQGAIAANRVELTEVSKGEENEPVRQKYLSDQKAIADKIVALNSKINDALASEENVRAFGSGMDVRDLVGDALTDHKPLARKLTGEAKELWTERSALVREQEAKKQAYLDSRPQPGKFSQYQLPGGTNYREFNYVLPHKAWFQELKDFGAKRGISNIGEAEEAYQKETGMTQRDYEAQNEPYKVPSAHQYGAQFGIDKGDSADTNRVFHLRTNDRTTADGRSMLFAEELQSDWHQTARDKGYQKKATPEELAKYYVEDDGSEGGIFSSGKWNVYDGDGNLLASPPKHLNVTAEAALRVVRRGAENGTLKMGAVPDAPFKGNAWKALGLKKLLAKAVEEGKDSIGWTQGIDQVKRYEDAMRKAVDQVDWITQSRDEVLVSASKDGSSVFSGRVGKDGKFFNSAPGTNGKTIEEVLGKDAAAKIREKERGQLTGKDLTVHGEGMKGFYDRELVNIANDIGKKYGAKVQKTEIPTKPKDVNSAQARERDFNPDDADFDPDELDAAEDPNKSDTKTVWQLPITPDLKAAVMKGQSLFMPESNYSGETSARDVDLDGGGYFLDRHGNLYDVDEAGSHQKWLAEHDAYGQGLLRVVAADDHLYWQGSAATESQLRELKKIAEMHDLTLKRDRSDGGFMPGGKSTSYQTKPAKTGALRGALPALDEKKRLPQKRGALQTAQ